MTPSELSAHFQRATSYLPESLKAPFTLVLQSWIACTDPRSCVVIARLEEDLEAALSHLIVAGEGEMSERSELLEARRRVDELDKFIDWIREDPSRLGGDGWAEQVWWEERRHVAG